MDHILKVGVRMPNRIINRHMSLLTSVPGYVSNIDSVVQVYKRAHAPVHQLDEELGVGSFLHGSHRSIPSCLWLYSSISNPLTE